MRLPFLVAAVLSPLVGSASADQSDPALGPLFEALAAPEGNAASVQSQIEDIWYRAPETGVGILFGRAIGAMNDGDTDLALVLIGHVNGLAPSFAEAWVLKGHALSRLGDNGAAALAYDQALSLEPRHYVAIARLGDLAVEAGDKRAGLDRYHDALLLNPHLDAVRERADRLRDETRAQEI
ncbi:hypothetical protein [Parvularcula dongshanensis]|uniref:Flp pilus assembly protein TadD n=1 Tax=Parvularcula dongshanensis TaxID=1173995 RepID=A0A840I4D8_9PROT|nr:hypothetical protein [Parvularcula dongshanensis]MBB4659212.1 Flp pilus assembly protein TadD [Parvularcula dongshanensis]